MPSITNILLNTPLWVFGLLAVLTWLGVQALQARTLPIWRVLATPAIFIAWGIASLVERSLSSPILVADSLSGSAFPIIRNLLIFAVKYGLGVALVLAPAFRYELSLADTAVSGATAGYFLDWLARFAAIYQRAADPIVAPARQ
jgi:hypothetical protein